MKLLPFLGLLIASKLLGNPLPSSPYVYSIGRAERSIDADLLKLHVVAQGTAVDYKTALSQMLLQASSVLSILEAASIMPGDIASHQLSAEPRYQRDDPARTITGYSVFQTIEVTLRDVNQAADMLPRILERGISTLQVGTPSSSKRKDVEQELTTEALRDARRRADEIAMQTGMRVSSVYAVSPVSFGEIESSFLQGEKRYKAFGSDAGGLKLYLPKIRVDVAVHAIFTLEKP
jgi:uncharacterized protein YggE